MTNSKVINGIIAWTVVIGGWTLAMIWIYW